MATHTVSEAQTALNAAGFGPINVDGQAGPETAAAVAKYQEARGITVTGQLDSETLSSLFPMRSSPEANKPRTIAATFQDYVLNFILSKTNWAAAAMVAVLVTFVQTKFGLVISPEMQATIVSLIAGVFGALIGLIQTRFNNPHVTTKQPGVVLEPSEFK